MKLSFSAAQFLRDCRTATRRYPMRVSAGYLSRSGMSLERKGLVAYRGFDDRLGRGGWFITPAGTKVLDEISGPSCRKCGCTDDDCLGCIRRTGSPCRWVEPNLCSACVP
jgi:hypothetical protein